MQGEVYGQVLGKVFVKQFGDAVGGGVVDRPEIADGGGDAEGRKAAVEAKDALAAVKPAIGGFAGAEHDQLGGGFVFGDKIGKVEGGIGKVNDRFFIITAIAGMGVELYDAITGELAAEAIAGSRPRKQVEGGTEIATDGLQRLVAALQGAQLHCRGCIVQALRRESCRWGQRRYKTVLQVAGRIGIADGVIVQQVGGLVRVGIGRKGFKRKAAAVGRYDQPARRRGMARKTAGTSRWAYPVNSPGTGG